MDSSEIITRGRDACQEVVGEREIIRFGLSDSKQE